MRGPVWLKVTPKGKDEVLLKVELKTVRQMFSFAWEMSRSIEVASWVRPIVFAYLLFATLRARSA